MNAIIHRETSRYLSTRGVWADENEISFLEVLLAGLAPDGGLYLPRCYPFFKRENLEEMRGMTYQELAVAIIGHFVGDDIPHDDLVKLVAKSYTPEIFCNVRSGENPADITPLRNLEPGIDLFGLSNGPTLAFKDVAMQLLGNFFEYALAKDGGVLNILGATSGDTGSAAEYAMLGKKGIRVFMLSPVEGMSEFQKAQMYSLNDPNIVNIAIHGKFDDAQDLVKALSNDAVFKERHHIGAVNSINWVRIMTQIVYYFKAYFAATKNSDEKVSFAIPSGNFGNAEAGHIARMMGLPIHQLIVATNENDVLDEFFRTGVYRPRNMAETHTTTSPSMDISKASNFERFVFDLVGQDPLMVRKLWKDIDTQGFFDLSLTPFFPLLEHAYGFVSGSSTHTDRVGSIRKVYASVGIVIDPHTADAFKIGCEKQRTGIPMIILETAQPAKFEDTIMEALGFKPEIPESLRGIETLPQYVRDVIDPGDSMKLKQIIADICE